MTTGSSPIGSRASASAATEPPDLESSDGTQSDRAPSVALPPPAELDLGGLARDDLVEWLETMMLIRDFETACDPLALAGKVIGGIHSSAGQEAVAVGAMRALEPQDFVAGSHRSHHHALARGLTPGGVMAELYGRETGVSEGRGGSMHLRDWSRGYAGGNGIVGAGVGIAMGLALSARLRAADQVAVGFVGDGGMNTGRTWEFVNLAVVWRLPLIVVCENNLYAVETPSTRLTGGASIVDRASGFGIPSSSVEGQDVTAVYRAVAGARRRATAGEGPSFIEARTYRYEGHSTGQVITYRTAAELEEWKRSRDPITRLADAMRAAGLLTEDEQTAIEARARARVADAIAFAEASPLPSPADAADDVTGIDLHVRGNA